MLRSLFVILLLLAPTAAADGTRRPQPPITAAAVDRFLAAHKGPVLDVSMAGDCDVALKRATLRAGYDVDIVDADHRRLADEQFLAAVRRHRAFVQANRNQALVLIVCCGGVRADAASKLLAAHGFNAMALSGGTTTVSPRLVEPRQ